MSWVSVTCELLRVYGRWIEERQDLRLAGYVTTQCQKVNFNPSIFIQCLLCVMYSLRH